MKRLLLLAPLFLSGCAGLAAIAIPSAIVMGIEAAAGLTTIDKNLSDISARQSVINHVWQPTPGELGLLNAGAGLSITVVPPADRIVGPPVADPPMAFSYAGPSSPPLSNEVQTLSLDGK